MKNNVKINTAAGVILFGLAAVFSISLLLVLFDFGGMSPAHNTYLYQAGKMFAGVYGICSALIPVFLFVSAVMCFTTKWRTRTGVILLGSVIPFFTLDALEHICRMLAKENAGDIFIMKLVAAVLTGVIIVAVEYLLLAILGEAIENHQGEPEETDDEAIVEEESASDEYYGSDSVNESYIPDEPESFDSNEGYLKEERTEIPENPVKYTPLKRFNIKDLEVPVEYEEKNDVEFKDETITHDEPYAAADVSQYAEQVENPIKTLQAEDPTVITEESVTPVDESETETAASEDVPAQGGAVTVDDDGSEASVEESKTGGFANDVYNYDDSIGITDDADIPYNEYDEDETQSVKDFFSDDELMPEEIESSEEEFLDDATEEIPDQGGASTADDDGSNASVEESKTEEPESNEEISDQGWSATDGDGSATSVEVSNTGSIANVDFGDATISSEIDGQEGDDLSDFVEKRNSSFDKIFSQMSEDAAQNPVVSEEDGFDDDLDSLFDEENPDEELSGVIEEERQFDPTAEPVVDANGVAYGTSVPFNTEDISFEDVAKARKNINSVKNANKSAVLNDSADIAEKLAPVEQLA